MSDSQQKVRSRAPGGLRLILLRFLLLLAVGVPAAGGGYTLTSKALDADPRYTGGELPEMTVLAGAIGKARSAGLALAAVGLVLFAVADQLMTAAAVGMLFSENKRGVWRHIWTDGWANLLPLLRVTVLAALLVVGGIALLKFPAEWLSDRALGNGWTGWKKMWVIDAGRVGVVLLWLHLVGAVARWSRVLVVADGKRRVRRVVLHALRVVWRAPIRTAIYFVLIPLGLQVGGGALLVSTAPFEGARLSDPVVGHAAWAGYLLLQACVWYFLLNRARALIERDRFDSIRSGGDEPFLVWLFTRRRRRRPPSMSFTP